jgi:UDPglucose--hexose-1-phosphate uridylyltransferase
MRGENSCHYHWHVELIPRVTEIAGFEWGTGFYINPMEPERAAEHLRAVTPEQVTEKISSDYVP